MELNDSNQQNHFDKIYTYWTLYEMKFDFKRKEKNATVHDKMKICPQILYYVKHAKKKLN